MTQRRIATWAAFVNFDLPALLCESNRRQATNRTRTHNNGLSCFVLTGHILITSFQRRRQLSGKGVTLDARRYLTMPELLQVRQERDGRDKYSTYLQEYKIQINITDLLWTVLVSVCPYAGAFTSDSEIVNTSSARHMPSISAGEIPDLPKSVGPSACFLTLLAQTPVPVQGKVPRRG